MIAANQRAVSFSVVQGEEASSNVPLPLAARLQLWAFLCPLALDFKGGFVGGNAFQFALLGITLLGAGLFMAQPKELRGNKALQKFIIAYWSFIGIATLAAVISKLLDLTDATPDTYARAILPYVLGGVALSVIQTVIRKRASLNELMLPLLLVGFVSGLFRYIYARAGMGVEVGELRYQIISPATLVVIPLFLTNLLFHDKINKFAALLAMGGLIGLFLSVTRTYIVVALVMMFTVPFFMFFVSKTVSARMRRRMVMIVALTIPLAVVTVSIGLAVRPRLLENWKMRLTQTRRTGVSDPSVIARKAAASGIWNAVHRDPYTLAFGKGFGGSSVYDPHYAPEYTRIVRNFPTTPTFTGMDSFFMTTLLFNGLFLGAGFVGLCVWAGVYACRAVKRQSIRASSMGYWAAFPLLTILAQAPICYLGDPLRERLSGILMGVTWGIAIVVGSLPTAATLTEEESEVHKKRPLAW